MNLKHILLRERGQSAKAIYCMAPYMTFWKSQKKIFLFSGSQEFQREGKDI